LLFNKQFLCYTTNDITHYNPNINILIIISKFNSAETTPYILNKKHFVNFLFTLNIKIILRLNIIKVIYIDKAGHQPLLDIIKGLSENFKISTL